jgi:hypothetical protein
MIGTKTTLRGTEIKNNDGVVLTPSIGQMLSALLYVKIPVIWWS